MSEQEPQRHTLAESDERFAKAFHASQEAILIARLSDWRLVEVNRRFEELYGAPADETLGRTSLELKLWADGPAARELILARLQSEGRIRDLEVSVRTSRGEVRTCSYSSEILQLGGEPHAIGFLRDVTDQRRAEEQRRQALARFATVFEHSPESIAIIQRRGGRHIAVNDAWVGLHGYPREQVIGRTSVEIGLMTRAESKAVAREREALGRLSNRSLSPRGADGKPRQVLLSAAEIEWDGEDCVLIMERDVTEVRRVEAEKAQALLRFATVFEHSPESISMVRLRDLSVVAVNDAWVQLNGYPREQVIGRTAVEIGLLTQTQLEELARERQARGPVITNRVLTLRRADGSLRQSLSSSATIEMDGERCVMWMERDITELQTAQGALAQSEQQLRELNASLEQRVRERTAELEAANRDLDSFGYSVSHDLRSPLGALNGFAYLLRTKEAANLSSDGEHLLAELERIAARMARLIDGLLEFSRLGRKPVAKVPVSMAALVEEVIAEIRAERPGLRAEFRVDPLPEARGDPVLLRQVWKNLLDNGVKYSRGCDPVSIEIGYAMRGEAYFVNDKGVGFDMAHAERLFGVFERLHGEKEFEGTGIGLAMVKRIVQRHGGWIAAEGRPGRGATFHFSLPAQ